MEEDRSAFKTLTGKPTEKRRLRRPRSTILGIDLKDISMQGIGLILLRIGIIGEPLCMDH